MSAHFCIGIDLGTTNSVLAYTSPPDDSAGPHAGDTAEIQLLEIPQLTAAATLESRQALPSFLFFPPTHERSAGNLRLPWEEQPSQVVGQWARQAAAEHPERTVAGAKSWLAYSAVDRHAPILPWGVADEFERISPVAATQRYLEHLIAAWNQAFPAAPFVAQKVVLTVPASFDGSACELTREAALAAGFPNDFVLLEEPQAAVYAWLADQGDRWRKQLAVGDRLLVCDVGGGTTDLTLIAAAEEDGQLILQRLAVGQHLLVGGDNMDLTLAHLVADRFQQQGVPLDAWQSISLWHACRAAKEALLGHEGPEHYPISVLGRGRRLIGGTVTADVVRAEVSQCLVVGFFPVCALSDRPARRRHSGFVQLGLPFETDTAITRHVAAFLGAHAPAGESAVCPTHLLFNGGVFRASILRQRMLEVLGHWFPAAVPRELAGHRDLDFAVARGAAFYGWTQLRGGMRIHGGTARSYYIGIETAGLSIPGATRPLKALCVVPFGMEEGTQIDVPASETGLVVGEPVCYRFFSSLVRKHDPAGLVLDRWTDEELQETDSLETCLQTTSTPSSPPPPAGAVDGDRWEPVRFQSRITELGELELWCVSLHRDERWKLSFRVRE